jgi:hypothetical protein
MRLNKYEFGIATGTWMWGRSKSNCECYLLDLGPFYFTILRGDCLKYYG